MEVKLSLLFLIQTSDVNHSKLWEELCEQSDGCISTYCHSKIKIKEDSFLSNSIIPEYYLTKWGGYGLSTAMMALLKNAFDDPTNTHFAFASESCVPIKNWNHIKERLQDDPRSRILYDLYATQKHDHRDRIKRTNYTPDNWVFSPQWVLLNREAVGFLLKHKEDIKKFRMTSCSDEHFISTILHSNGYSLHNNVCRENVTWTHWNGGWSPQTFGANVDFKLFQELKETNDLFARKFSPDSNIGSYGLHL
jgi:hypothetical protein